MLIRIHGIIIMIYMIFWGYHIRNNQTKKLVMAPLPCAKTMAHGKDLNFAVCHVCRAHGKGLATSSFLGGNFFLPWVDSLHTANPLPCARYIAHGKGRLCRSLVAVCALPCAAHGKRFVVGFRGFTVCPWHTAKGGSPVVPIRVDTIEAGRIHALFPRN